MKNPKNIFITILIITTICLIALVVNFRLVNSFVEGHNTLIITILTFLSVTISFCCIIFTYYQVYISYKSLINIKQPILTVTELSGDGTEKFTETRRQLFFKLKVKNVGDSPAISVLLFSMVHLQNNQDINMEHIPDMCHCIEPGTVEELSTRYETKEINAILEDFQKQVEKNIERVRIDPSKQRYRYPYIINEIYYKNVAGQWYKYISHTELGRIFAIRNGQEIKIEARDLQDSERFIIKFINPIFGIRNITLVDEKEVIDKLKSYERDIDAKNIKI